MWLLAYALRRFGLDDSVLTDGITATSIGRNFRRHELSNLFKKSHLRLVDQASRWPQWDRPEVVADLIKGSIAATAI